MTYAYESLPPTPSYLNTTNRLERMKRIVAERTGFTGDALLNAHWDCVALHQRRDPLKKRIEWRQTIAFLIKWKKLVGLVFNKRDGLHWVNMNPHEPELTEDVDRRSVLTDIFGPLESSNKRTARVWVSPNDFGDIKKLCGRNWIVEVWISRKIPVGWAKVLLDGDPEWVLPDTDVPESELIRIR